MKRALMIMALLFLSGTVHAQIQEADTFDEKTGVLKLDTAKEITIADKFELRPIKVSGVLDKDKPQILKAGEGKAFRFLIETDLFMQEPKLETVITKIGDGKEARFDTTYVRSDSLTQDSNVRLRLPVDCKAAEIYSDRLVLTGFDGKATEYKLPGTYRMYVIDR